MSLDEAVKLLEPLQGKSAANLLMRYSAGTIKRAVRVVYNRRSATKDHIHLASTVEARLLAG